MASPRDSSSRGLRRIPLESLWLSARTLIGSPHSRSVLIPAALALAILATGASVASQLASPPEVSPEVYRQQITMIATVGPIVAATIAFLAHLQLTRTQRTEELVRQRTADLEEEIRVRTDIDRKLQRNQDILTAAQRIAQIGHWEWNLVTNDVVWSDETFRIFGLDPTEQGASYPTFLERVHPDDRKLLQLATSRALAGEQDYRVELRIVRPDGSFRTVSEAGVITRDDDGRAIHMLGVTHDITDRVEPEQALAHTNKRLEQAQLIAHVGHWDWNIVTNNLTWSDEVYRIFGLRPQEFGATYPAFLERIHPDDRAGVEAAVGRAVAGEEEYAIDHRVIRPDGEIRTVHESGLISWSNDGQPLRMLGVVHDITERAAAEQALEQNNRYLRTIADTAQSALLLMDQDRNIILANQAASDMLGYSLEELTHLRPREFDRPDEQEINDARRLQLEEGGTVPPRYRRRVMRKDGTSVWIEAAASALLRDGTPTGYVAEYRDITYQLEAEQQLRDSAERLELAQSMAHLGSWGRDLATNEGYWSDELFRLLGRDPVATMPSPSAHRDHVHPDDAEWYDSAVADFRDEHTDTYDVHARFIGADGVTRVLQMHGERTRDQDGSPQRLEGTALDVTELANAQTAIAESTAQLELAQSMAHIGSWGRDADRDDGYWSDEMYRLLGLEPGTPAPSRWLYQELVHPDDRARFDVELHDFREGRVDSHDVQARFIGADGVTRVLRMHGKRTRDELGNPLRLEGTAQDVTAEVEADRQIRESADRLELAQSMAHIGSWVRNVVDGRRYWSDEFFRLLGYEPTAELPSRTSYRGHIHPDDHKRYMAELRDFREEVADTYDAQARFVGADGVVRVLHMHGERTRDQDGTPLQEDGTGQDITELVRAQRAVSESAERLELAQSMAHIGSWGRYLDSDDGYWSDEMYRLLGYEPGDTPPPLYRFIEHVHPEDRERFEAEHRSFRELEVDSYEIQARFIGADAITRVLRIHAERTRDEHGQPLRLEGTAQDVTAAVQAERLIRESADRLELAQSMAHLGSWGRSLTDDTDRYWSDELYRLFGLEPQSIPSHPRLYMDYVHPDDHDRFTEELRPFGKSLTDTFDTRARFIGADGVQRVIQMHGERVRDANGSPVRLEGTGLDVTAAVEAERQIRDSAERLGLAQSMAHVGSWGRSLVGNDGYWSDEMFRILGYEPGATQPSPGRLMKSLHPDDRDAYNEALRNFREDRSDTYDAEARFIGADGVERTLRMHGRRTRDAAGNPLRLDGTGQDITTRVIAEAERDLAQEQLTEELQRAGEVQRAFQPGTNAKFQMLSVAGQCLPAHEVGGDFFDWAPFDDGGVRVTIGDVMGKGIPAAIFMSMTQTALRASGRPDARSGSGPAGQLSRVNRALYPYLSAAESFVTAFTAEVDRDGRVTYADAGHGHAAIRRQDGSFVDLRSIGLPIGVGSGTTYASSNAQLEPGDTLLLMTDGLRDLLDNAVDEGEWTDLLGATIDSWENPQQTAARIVQLAQQVAPNDGLEDDLTIVVLTHDGATIAIDPDTIPTGELKLTVPPRLGALATAESDLQLFLRQLHVGEQRSGAFLTATHEILANIIEHARPTTNVSLTIDVSEHAIVLTTGDDGRPFDASEAKQAARDASDRGRGLAMCEILLDRTDHVRTTNGQNQWQLEMKLLPLPTTATP